MHPDWNERYAEGRLPWDSGVPDENLMELVKSGVLAPGRVLEVGCGTGTNAHWLAQQGFQVLGVDVSPLAIEKARAKGDKAAFEVREFLSHDPSERYDLVFDRGCYHVFEDADRDSFVARVAQQLAPGGHWLSLIGSTEGAPRDVGPPRRSAREILDVVEPVLELVELRSIFFDGDIPAWRCLSRVRKMPAQPSTRF
jgi:SAM-dependent methyltransferase